MLTQMYLRGRVLLVFALLAVIGAPTAPGFLGAAEYYTVARTRPKGQPDRRPVLAHKRGPLQPQQAEQSTLENLVSDASVSVGSGRDVFGVA
jgi:hypothetical protein